MEVLELTLQGNKVPISLPAIKQVRVDLGQGPSRRMELAACWLRRQMQGLGVEGF
jgi:hypothetical protein